MNECCRATFLDATGFTTWLSHCGLSLVLLVYSCRKYCFPRLKAGVVNIIMRKRSLHMVLVNLYLWIFVINLNLNFSDFYA